MSISKPTAGPRTRFGRDSEGGFSLVEMLVAITVTLIIMGSVYGMIAQGSNAFGREPLVADRQQQLRLAMDRIQKDIVAAGAGLGPLTQTFATGLNAQGPLGVRPAADVLMGGGLSDYLEIRSAAVDCPPARTVAGVGASLSAQKIQTIDSLDALVHPCFVDPGWVFLLYPNGWSKFGWLSNHTGADQVSTFTAPQPPASEIVGGAASTAHVLCSIPFGPGSPNGVACPALPALAPPPTPTPNPQAPVGSGCPGCDPYAVQKAEFIRYQLGADTDGVISLFRHTAGGIEPTAGLVVGQGAPTDPPGPVLPGVVSPQPAGTGWQLVARGIEDFQVEYRTLNSGAGWLDTPVLITNNLENLVAGAGPRDIVVEVRVTLWSRVVGDQPQVAGNRGNNLSGESRAAGNQIQAVRGSFVSRVAPRAAQEALGQDYLRLWR